MRGVARNLERTQEGGKTVLRFVIEREDLPPMPVEMRGDAIYGLVNVGDMIEINSAIGDQQPHGLFPKTVSNVSTQTTVEAWRRPLWRRAPPYVVVTLLAGFLSAAGGRMVVAVFPPRTPDAHRFPEEQRYLVWGLPDALPVILLMFAAAAVAAGIQILAFCVHRAVTGRELSNDVRWAVCIGSWLGLLAGTLPSIL